MSPEVSINYYLAHQSEPINPAVAQWDRPLPVSRTTAADPQNSTEPSGITYGIYFTAVRSFLCRNAFAVVSDGMTGEDISTPGAIRAIAVYLVKHGQFYHPAKVDVRTEHASATFVVNVAISDAGREAIEREFGLLRRLSCEVADGALPRVYGFGRPVLATGHDLHMFLGQWFEDYHEFHLTRRSEISDTPDTTVSGRLRHVVWDSQRRPPRQLSSEQSAALYRAIAAILTRYYNPLTFEQIFPWHHAAGDFIVKLENGQVAVKLITVRRYAPSFRVPAATRDDSSQLRLVLEALLVFLLNLLIRLRLDRLDGIGEVAWADEGALENGLLGFWEALALKSTDPRWPIPLAEAFRLYVAEIEESDLYELSQTMVRNQNPATAELEVVQQYLSDHVSRLRRLLRPAPETDIT